MAFERRYSSEVAVDPTPESIVAGWSEGLTDILSRLETDLRETELR